MKKGIENELPKMLKLRYVRFWLKDYAVSKLYTKGIGLCVLLWRKINSILTFLGLLRGRKDHPLVLEDSNSKFEHGIFVIFRNNLNGFWDFRFCDIAQLGDMNI